MCSVHHFMHTGRCPFCEQERIELLSKRFSKSTERDEQIEPEASKEITMSDIEKLKNHFNH